MVSGTFEQLLENLRLLLDEVSSLQEKHSAPTLDFKGYPASFIAPSGNDADYQTQNENERIYAFDIWTFVEYDATLSVTAYKSLIGCVDDIINKIDEQSNPENASMDMARNLGDGVTLFGIRALPSQFVPDLAEKLLAAKVTVRCKVSIDLTLLT